MFYIAFILDEPIYNGKKQIADEGVDLLAGAFKTQAEAVEALRNGAFPRHRLLLAYTTQPARIAVIEVTEEQVTRYIITHGAGLTFPPRCLPKEEL